MKIIRTTVLVIAILLVGFASFSVGKALATGTFDLAAPAWVTREGVVDVKKLPECFQVVGADGQTVKDEQGKPLCIPSQELFAPPGESSAQDSDGTATTALDGKEFKEVPFYRPSVEN